MVLEVRAETEYGRCGGAKRPVKKSYVGWAVQTNQDPSCMGVNQIWNFGRWRGIELLLDNDNHTQQAIW